MNLRLEAWACGERLSERIKEDHGRWMGRGADDQYEKERIDLIRQAARPLKTCASELEHVRRKAQDEIGSGSGQPCPST